MDDGGPVRDDDSLEREGGVFVPRTGGRDVGCDDAQDRCAPDDVLEDQVNDEHIPGTVDDMAYDYGTEEPAPTDQLLMTIETGYVVGMGDVGETGYDEDMDEPALGAPDERELWRQQRGLMDEDRAQPYGVAGTAADDVPAIERALGEDAAGPLVQSEEGTSATGSTSIPERGGFPEESDE